MAVFQRFGKILIRGFSPRLFKQSIACKNISYGRLLYIAHKRKSNGIFLTVFEEAVNRYESHVEKMMASGYFIFVLRTRQKMPNFVLYVRQNQNDKIRNSTRGDA